MSRPSFREALRGADAALTSAGIPAEVEQRLDDRVLGLQRRPVRLIWMTAAAATVAGLLVVILTHRSGPPSLAGLVVATQTADFATQVDNNVITVLRGTGELVDPRTQTSLTAARGARLACEPDGVRVHEGRVEVRARLRRQGVTRVLVSHGAIEVVGTRFSIEQHGEAGRVDLYEGKIRFVATSGWSQELMAGESLAWPLPAVPERPSPVKQGDMQRPASGPPPPTLAHILDRVERLRSIARFDQAASVLSEALSRPDLADAHERLSYELGSILSNQLGDRARACAHWRQHLRSFPSGRYGEEISAIEKRLACGP